MPKTFVKSLVLLNILICLSQAALVKNPATQSQPPFANNYQQNSLDEPRFPARSSANSHERYSSNYDQVNNLENRVLDNFNHRYPDGSYEFRYELADGQARYERGYFIKVNKQKELVVVGYYSYRMTDGKFVTVFYNADRNGYRQNQSITRDSLPDLPRTIDVPQFNTEDAENIPTTTRKPNYNVGSTTNKHNRS